VGKIRDSEGRLPAKRFGGGGRATSDLSTASFGGEHGMEFHCDGFSWQSFRRSISKMRESTRIRGYCILEARSMNQACFEESDVPKTSKRMSVIKYPFNDQVACG